MIDKRLSHILLVLYLFFLTHGDRLAQTKKTCRRKKIDAVGGGERKKKMTKDTKKKMAEGREGKKNTTRLRLSS